MVEQTKTDGRREAGERTRQRLIDATRALIAERGEDAVTLRDITDAADANVAAVSYHFGSLPALVNATVVQAIAALMEDQIERLQALSHDAGVHEIAGALAHSVVATAGVPNCAERAFMRIMARALIDPPPDLAEWISATIARSDAEILPRLQRALPHVPQDELQFRRECVAGIMNFIVSGRMRINLHTKSPDELEQLLIPVITGALAGGAVL